jgi:uncharacterized membrane protein YkoI
MNIKRTLAAAFAVVVATGAAGGMARAEDRDSRDAAALANMRVTLQQAIATAEGQAGGRAIGADVSQEGGTPRISVEVAGPQGVKTVLVDGATGQVTATRDGGAEDND